MEQLAQKIRHLRYKSINPNQNRYSHLPNSALPHNLRRCEWGISVIPERWDNINKTINNEACLYRYVTMGCTSNSNAMDSVPWCSQVCWYCYEYCTDQSGRWVYASMALRARCHWLYDRCSCHYSPCWLGYQIGSEKSAEAQHFINLLFYAQKC